MSSTPSYVGVAGLCAECMRDNVNADRNFCEKNIMAGACDLCVPKPLYAIATEHKQAINMKPITMIAICVICAAIYGCAAAAQSLGDDDIFCYEIDWEAKGGYADSHTLILVDAVEIREERFSMLRVCHAHTRISWGIGDHTTMHTVMLRWSDVWHSYYCQPGCYIQYLPELIYGYPAKCI